MSPARSTRCPAAHADELLDDLFAVQPDGHSVEAHQLVPQALAQVSDHPEIHGSDDRSIHDEEVAGVGVGVEEAINERLLDDDLRGVEGNLMAVHPGDVQGLNVVHLDAADSLQDENPSSGVVPVDPGDVKIGFVGEVPPEAVGVAPLAAVVHLCPQGVGEFLGDRGQVVELPQRGTFLDQAGQVEEDLQIHGDELLDLRALNLDHHLLAAGQDGPVHLGQRGSSQGFGLKGGEQFIQGAP